MYEPQKQTRTAFHLTMVGMYTGAATVNGQGWIEGVDYSQAVDLDFTSYSSNLRTHLALSIKKAEDEEFSHIKEEAEFALLELFVRLGSVCGVSLGGLSPNVCGIGRAFAAAAANIPEAEPLIKALEGVDSLSNVSQVALILKAAFDLACAKESLSTSHPELVPLATPKPVGADKSVLNDLQVYLKTTQGVTGVLFGLDFCLSFGRAVNEGFFEIVTEKVHEKVQVMDRVHVSDGRGDYTTIESVLNGSDALESYVQDLIDDGTPIVAYNFNSCTLNGSGKFSCNMDFVEKRTFTVVAHAVDYKVTEVVFHSNR